MTGFLTTVSLLWLLPAVCHALDIPLQSALLIKGEPVGFTRPSHRQKRSEALNGTLTCNEDEYNPSKTQHCCNKCLAGFKVTEDCAHGGMKTICEQCPKGTFMKTPNSNKRCKQCSDCLTQFGQVTLLPCTTINNTVCGCPAGQYKSKEDRKFTCLECSKCNNGTVLLPCRADHNTVCKCFFNFYHDSNGNCRPCEECNNTEDCFQHCPQPHPSRKIPNDVDVIRVIVPSVVAIAVLAVAVFLIVINRKKIPSFLHTKKPVPATDISGSTQMSTPLMDSSKPTCKLNTLPGHAVYVVEDSEFQHQNTAQNSSLPLPDITLETTTPCLNRPEVLYKIIECIPVGSWRELIRRLGVSDQVIDQSEYDYRRYKDAQYAMLSFWVHNEGHLGATRDSLFRVLRDMNLGGCIEKIEESL